MTKSSCKLALKELKYWMKPEKVTTAATSIYVWISMRIYNANFVLKIQKLSKPNAKCSTFHRPKLH